MSKEPSARGGRRAANRPVDAPGTAAAAHPSRRVRRQSQPGSVHGDGRTDQRTQPARDELLASAREQLANLPVGATGNPLQVDAAVLAQQQSLAARAATLNQQAHGTQMTVGPSAGSRPPTIDPAAAHNLAMVTPLEFIRVPGIERPVMRPPVTSHIPILPRPVQPVAQPAVKDAVPNVKEAVQDAVPNVEADAVAQPAPAPAPVEEMPARSLDTHPPLPAGSAHGLEPLDAVTAGLGRVRRVRMIQWGVVAVGALTLIAGLTLIITGTVR